MYLAESAPGAIGTKLVECEQNLPEPDDKAEDRAYCIEQWEPNDERGGMIRASRLDQWNVASRLEESYHGFANAILTVDMYKELGLGNFTGLLGLETLVQNVPVKMCSGQFTSARTFVESANNVAERLDQYEDHQSARFNVFEGDFYDAIDFATSIADSGMVPVSAGRAVFHDQYGHSLAWALMPGEMFTAIRTNAQELCENLKSASTVVETEVARRQVGAFMRQCDRNITNYRMYVAAKHTESTGFVEGLTGALNKPLAELPLQAIQQSLQQRITAAKQL
jgi:hypothetical protein